MKAGAAVRDFTPRNSQFLCGYPHVERMSEGVHDPLLSSAFYLENRGENVLFIANDILCLTKAMVRKIRREIAAATGMDELRILVSATHTHSGPRVADSPFQQHDPVVPPVDNAFVERMVAAIAEAGIAAVAAAVPATVGFGRADSTGIGTNRHDPAGPADHEVPVLAARSIADERWIGWMYVCSMHPTVLHEDSRRVSADFPWAARRRLRERLLGPDGAVLHHLGCAGNQSPRHVTRDNTFAEADRIGSILGDALAGAARNLVFDADPELKTAVRCVDPPRADLPSVAEAEQRLDRARRRFAELKRSGPAARARTAECDVFGAEHKRFLAQLAASGGLEAVYASCTPAEIMAVQVGDWCFVGWPSETYVEYGLAVKAACRDTFVITLANGRALGYVTTPEAAAAGRYEAGASLFAPETGQRYVDTTVDLVNREVRRASP